MDVAIQLRHEWTTIPQRFNINHVNGHQDKEKDFKDLPITAQLNVLMDKKSKEIVELTYNDNNTVIPLPAQIIYIASNQPIVQGISNVLISRQQNKQISEFYFKHHLVRPSVIHIVDWNAITKAFGQKSELSYRKTFHNLRNTMTVNKRWKWSDSDICSLCQAAPETTRHMMQCKHEDMENVRTLAVEKFRKCLKKLNTHPLVLTHWMTQINQFIKSAPTNKPQITMDPCTWTIMQAHQQHDRIGWNAFFNGMVAKKWTEIQLKHYEEGGDEK